MSQNERELLEKNGYTFGSFPECKKALVTEYPYRNYLSILIAVKRVYPSLMQYIKVHNDLFIENIVGTVVFEFLQ